MRSHDQVAQPRVDGQRGAQRRRTSGRLPVLLEQLAHARRVDQAAGVRLREHGVQLGGAVLVEQQPELKGGAAKVLAALGAAQQEIDAVRRGVLEAVHAAVLVGFAFLGHERGDVRGVLDALAAVPRARVRGDELGAIDDADGVHVGDDRELAADVGAPRLRD